MTTVNSITDEIRSKLLSWGKKKKLTLLENQHFTILVKNDSGKFCASIKCGCGKTCIINQKANSWLISNWTRHFQACAEHNKNGQGKQAVLSNYFMQQQNASNAASELIPSYVPFHFPNHGASTSNSIATCSKAPNVPQFPNYCHPSMGYPYNSVANFNSPYVSSQSLVNPHIHFNPAGDPNNSQPQSLVHQSKSGEEQSEDAHSPSKLSDNSSDFNIPYPPNPSTNPHSPQVFQ